MNECAIVHDQKLSKCTGRARSRARNMELLVGVSNLDTHRAHFNLGYPGDMSFAQIAFTSFIVGAI